MAKPIVPDSPTATGSTAGLRADIARWIAAVAADRALATLAEQEIVRHVEASLSSLSEAAWRTEYSRELQVLRGTLEPKLVHLVCGLRHHQVTEAMRLLLDYVDLRSAPPAVQRTKGQTA